MLPGMRFFDRLSSFWLVVLGLPLLFLPKINLISLGARETAGIRIDDMVLFGFCLIIFWAHFALKKKMCPLELWIVALLAFSLISFFSNRILVSMEILRVNASIFYCVRLFEYFLFFYIGALCTQFFPASKVIAAFFGWNLFLMILQKIGLVGQFSVSGYEATATDRVVGIASFPSEAGVLIDMVFCFLVFNKEPITRVQNFFSGNLRLFLSQTYVYWLFLICSALVINTGSRIAIVALFVAFLFRIKNDLTWHSLAPWLYAGVFLTIGAAMAIVMISQTESVSTRSAGLLSWKNLDLIRLVWDHINLNYDPIGHETIAHSSDYDMSWWMRIHKWCYALKIYYLHPECYLQGIGPGFAMAAVDGGFVRILTEYGLIGCFLFWKVFSQIYRQSPALKWMVIAFLINMIFFDVYLAYKPMSLLLFVSGCAYSMAENRPAQHLDLACDLR